MVAWKKNKDCIKGYGRKLWRENVALREANICSDFNPGSHSFRGGSLFGEFDTTVAAACSSLFGSF